MKRRTTERLKTLLIAALLLSALVLTLSANLFGDPLQTPWVATLVRPFASLLGYHIPQLPTLVERPMLSDAAQPQLITVRTSAGRTSWYGDTGRLDTAFDALGSFLAEALDTAETPTKITRRQFQISLREKSVYFEYPCALPMKILCAWLDANGQMDLTAAGYALHMDENTVTLLVDTGDALYRFPTRVDATMLSAALDNYPDDGTFFAFESTDSVYVRLNPLTLIAPHAAGLCAVAVSNPCDDAFIAKAANLLGFNPYGDASYRDDTGAVIYTESNCTLRVSADGTLLLRNLGLSGRYVAESAREADLIEYMRSTLSDLLVSVQGDGRLQLTGLGTDAGAVTVRFDYFVSGTQVALPGGSAVEAVFSGETLSSLTVRARGYTTNAAQTLPALPVRQAAAIAPQGDLLRLQYADRGTGALQAGWR